MKFLLIAVNAKYIHANPALYSLRAYAREKEPVMAAGVEIVEYTINQRVEDVVGDIYERCPDVAAFSCYIWNWRMVREIFTILHQLRPELPIWLGGPEASFDSEEILERYPFLTGIMRGEGEFTFSELLAYYGRNEGGENLSYVAGLVYRDAASGQIYATGKRQPVKMDRLPFFYREALGNFQNRILYYESGRGCPFHCSYCLSCIDKEVRLRSLFLVKKELQFFLDQRPPQVKFIDRTFNCDRERAREIWRYLHEHDNGVTNFHFEIAAELLDEETLALLAGFRPGLVQLEIGLQSTNEETLRAVGRFSDVRRLRHVIGRLREAGNIHLHLDLIAGLPSEDMESFCRSFVEAYSMRPHQLQLGFLKVLKGTPMAAKAAEYGLVYREEPPYEVLATKWLSYEEIRRLKRVEEMVELYFNSGQFSRTLPVLELQFDGPFALFEALADFYREKGWETNNPSRIRRYEILLAFAIERDPARAELYKELLIFDLYLRENLKSRPDFAPDQERYREQIAAVYREEERRRYLLPDYEGYDRKQLRKMTHLEVFSWPVYSPAGRLSALFDEGGPGKRETMLLFDYQRRDPVDGNVVFLPVEEGVRELG